MDCKSTIMKNVVGCQLSPVFVQVSTPYWC